MGRRGVTVHFFPAHEPEIHLWLGWVVPWLDPVSEDTPRISSVRSHSLKSQLRVEGASATDKCESLSRPHAAISFRLIWVLRLISGFIFRGDVSIIRAQLFKVDCTLSSASFRIFQEVLPFDFAFIGLGQSWLQRLAINCTSCISSSSSCISSRHSTQLLHQ